MPDHAIVTALMILVLLTGIAWAVWFLWRCPLCRIHPKGECDACRDHRVTW